MVIWSIHPKYPDSKGLVAVWRESLLAKNVLENKTKGYKNHPQLTRFREAKNPLDCISQYLVEIYNESAIRNYSFSNNKFKKNFEISKLTVTDSQINFEIEHLKRKLKQRDREKLKEVIIAGQIQPHPLFTVIPGEIESWEKI